MIADEVITGFAAPVAGSPASTTASYPT